MSNYTLKPPLNRDMEVALRYFRAASTRLTVWQKIKALLAREEKRFDNRIKVSHAGFFGCVRNFNGELYIGIPGICRIWLKKDGKYSLDIPNEPLEEIKQEQSRREIYNNNAAAMYLYLGNKIKPDAGADVLISKTSEHHKKKYSVS